MDKLRIVTIDGIVHKYKSLFCYRFNCYSHIPNIKDIYIRRFIFWRKLPKDEIDRCNNLYFREDWDFNKKIGR